MKQLILIFAIILTVQACKTPPKGGVGSVKTIDIDVNSAINTLDITNIIDTHINIELETNKRCLLGLIKKMVITEHELLILDDFVYVFDLNGAFKFKFGNKGKGPGESLTVSDFIIDFKSGNVEIYDFSQNKVCVYSKKGKYLKEFRFPFGRIVKFEKMNNGDYLVWKCMSNLGDENGFLGYKIHIGNLKDGFIRHMPMYLYDDNTTINQSFVKSGDNYYYSEVLGDTIYEINKDNEFSSKYHINFGKNKMPKELQRKELYDRLFALKNNKDVASLVDDFYQTLGFLYFNFLYNKMQYNVLIEDSIPRIGNKLVCNGIEYPNFRYFNGSNTLASIGYPQEMSQSLKRAIKGNFDISNNPVISIFKLK